MVTKNNAIELKQYLEFKLECLKLQGEGKCTKNCYICEALAIHHIHVEDTHKKLIELCNHTEDIYKKLIELCNQKLEEPELYHVLLDNGWRQFTAYDFPELVIRVAEYTGLIDPEFYSSIEAYADKGNLIDECVHIYNMFAKISGVSTIRSVGVSEDEGSENQPVESATTEG